MENDREIRELVAGRLRDLRKRGGYKLADFAARIGVDGPRLSRMETGKQSISTLVLRRAATVLEVPMDAFFVRASRPVTHLRADTGAQGEELIVWAKALRADLDLIEEHDRGRAA